jgi:hypothetical protein
LTSGDELCKPDAGRGWLIPRKGQRCGAELTVGSDRSPAPVGHEPSFPTRSTILLRRSHEGLVSGEVPEPHVGPPRAAADVVERRFFGKPASPQDARPHAG